MSGSIWLASWEMNETIFRFAKAPTGFTLIYLPAGVCFMSVLIAGVAGAVGIALAFPIALVQVLPGATPAEAVTYGLIAGVLPYLAVEAMFRYFKVSSDLRGLRSNHLPAIAAVTALSTSATASIAFAAFGRSTLDQFIPNTVAKAAGDFIGCFLVIVLVRTALGIASRFKS